MVVFQAHCARKIIPCIRYGVWSHPHITTAHSQAFSTQQCRRVIRVYHFTSECLCENIYYIVFLATSHLEQIIDMAIVCNAECGNLIFIYDAVLFTIQNDGVQSQLSYTSTTFTLLPAIKSPLGKWENECTNIAECIHF